MSDKRFSLYRDTCCTEFQVVAVTLSTPCPSFSCIAQKVGLGLRGRHIENFPKVPSVVFFFLNRLFFFPEQFRPFYYSCRSKLLNLGGLKGMKMMMIIQMTTIIMMVMMNSVMVVKTVGIPDFLWCTSTECDGIFERQFPSLFLPNSLTLPLEWKHLNFSSKCGQLDMFSNKWQFAKKNVQKSNLQKKITGMRITKFAKKWSIMTICKTYYPKGIFAKKITGTRISNFAKNNP